MSEFDPYFKWLGIPPEDQPPDHYRLLGIPRFTSDPNVIVHAFDLQVALVRTFVLGPHSLQSQLLLNALAAAKVCLDVPEKKAAYDKGLREQVSQNHSYQIPVHRRRVVSDGRDDRPGPSQADRELKDERFFSRRTSQKRQAHNRSRMRTRRLIGIIGAATGFLAVAGFVVFTQTETPEAPDVSTTDWPVAKSEIEHDGSGISPIDDAVAPSSRKKTKPAVHQAKENLVSLRDHLFIIDISASTFAGFAGASVGDVNGDGESNTILDAELAGFIALNDQLITSGKGTNVGIVVFGKKSRQLDMDRLAAGLQLTAAPDDDNDANGVPDVEDVLRAVLVGDFTVFEPPLQHAEVFFSTLGTPAGLGRLVFLSDGVPFDAPAAYADEVVRLRAMGIDLRAFGVGAGASLPALAIIDPNAVIVMTSDVLVDTLIHGMTRKEVPQPRASNLDEGLIAFYPLDGNLRDESGNGLHARCASTPNFGVDRHGKQHGAVEFPGTRYFQCDVPTGQLPRGESARSVSLWLKAPLDPEDGLHAIWAAGKANNARAWYLQIEGNGILRIDGHGGSHRVSEPVNDANRPLNKS
jgi:hypothetical protein